MRIIRISSVLVVPALLFMAGCTSDQELDNRVPVVATTTQVADLVRGVGGDRVAVKQILGPTSDPHEYEPRPSDAAAAAQARVAFSSGGDLDTWLSGVVSDSGGSADQVKLLDVVKVRKSNEGSAGPDSSTDPHWWQDPRNAIHAVDEIERVLTEVDAGNASYFNPRADVLRAKLELLDTDVAACIKQIPPEKRKLVTDHDALGYYADRYGIDVIGTAIPSLSTQAEPSVGQTAKLVDQIKRENVEAVFPESSVNPKLAKAIAGEAGARVGAPLYADTLGPKGSKGENYIGSIEANTQAIASGLTDGKVTCKFS